MVVRRALLFACVAAAVLSTVEPSRASEVISLYGGERAGTSGGQFLRVPTGARSIAMGGGMSAAVNGGDAPFWNPAGMITVSTENRIFVSHTEYAADIAVDHIAYTRKHGPWRYAIFGGVLQSGDILRTDELHPTGQGFTFTANQFFAGLSVGRQLTDRFTVAASGKFLQENLDEYSNQGWFIDLGALYYVGFRSARIGFTVLNFGGDMKLNGSPDDANLDGWQSYSAPTVANFGAAYDFGNMDRFGLTVAFEFRHPSDEDETIILGGELAMLKTFYLRAGQNTSTQDGGRSVGFGLNWGKDKVVLRAGYAYEDRGAFGGLHTISLEFGK
jgi:hypothetical protein